MEHMEIVSWQQDRSTFHALQDSGDWIGQGHKFSVARGQRLTRQWFNDHQWLHKTKFIQYYLNNLICGSQFGVKGSCETGVEWLTAKQSLIQLWHARKTSLCRFIERKSPMERCDTLRHSAGQELVKVLVSGTVGNLATVVLVQLLFQSGTQLSWSY